MPRIRLLVPVLLGALALPFLGLDAPPSSAEDKKPTFTPEEKKIVFDLVNPRKGEVIADLGCGYGTWTFPLARAVGPTGRIYAVDVVQEKLDAIDKRLQEPENKGLRIKTIPSVQDDPRLGDDSLDAVFLRNVIGYVERRAQAAFLQGIRRALKPTGRLIILDPKWNPERVISECYRAGFTLKEARIPQKGLPPPPDLGGQWYALKLRRAENPQPAILPRKGEPKWYRTRLHLAEELYRFGLLTREELGQTWERIQNRPGDFDPDRDERLDMIAAAAALEVVSPEKAEALRKRVRGSKKGN